MKRKATVRIVLDRKLKGDKRLLLIRVSYNRKYREYSIGDETVRLNKEQFNNPRLAKTKDAMIIANRALRIAEEIVAELGINFTFEAFKERYHKKLRGQGEVSNSFVALLAEYFDNHKLAYKTKKSYETSVNWVIRYNEKATLSTITPEFVEGLISFMKQEHLRVHHSELSQNSRNIYLRQLRAIYNYAIEHGYTNNNNPFAIKNLGSIRRQKAALTEEELKRFLEYTPKNKEEEIGKDFFLLSLHCSGANLGDILSFKNSDIENGTITFVRRKTKRKRKFKNAKLILPVFLLEQPTLFDGLLDQ